MNQTEDRALDAHGIQQLAHADAVVAFFAQLGYDTGARIEQRAGAIGITARSP